jgi:hypothetical protein
MATCNNCGQKLTSIYYLKQHMKTKKCTKKADEQKADETKKENSVDEESPRLDPRYVNSATIKTEYNVSSILKDLKNLKLDVDKMINKLEKVNNISS